MTLHDYLVSLRKSWWIIVALTLLGGILGFGYAAVQPEIFRSQAAVVIVPTRGDNTSELVQGSNYVQNLVQTYAVVATSPTVLEPVVQELDLPYSPRGLAAMVTVEAPLNTQVLQIAVTSRDRQQAAEIANAVSTQLAEAVRNLSPQNAEEQPTVRVETITPATASTFPISPNTRLITALGIVGGLVVGVASAILRRLLGTRLGSNADIEAITDLPVLGDVYATPSDRTLPLVVRTDPTSAVAESVRSVVAGLRFANVDSAKKVLLFTSSSTGDGKSSVSVATALILAEQGHTVLLIDADLRRASISNLTQLEGSVGLTSVLLGEATVEAAIQPFGEHGAEVLTSGALPPNPGQLLTSHQVTRVVEAARDRYDYVVIDSPPVLAVADPLVLARVADGIVVIVRARSTKRDSLTRTLAALESSRTEVLGIVLNGVRRAQTNPYYEIETRRAARPTAKQAAARGLSEA